MKLILHGGFFSESSTNADMKAAKQNALRDITERSYDFLKTHTALEAVVYAVALLEDCDLFNAGLGSQIQSDGKIRMSASLMDGSSKKFSGVINIENVKNPVKVAECLMNYDDRVLGGEGALTFAREKGFPSYNPELPQRRKEYEAKLMSAGVGTVGCVALDSNGNIAAATSTGGKGFEMPGRISDSATTAGNFASSFAGVSCTGVGEDIVSAALASNIVTRLSDGMSIDESFKRSFAELKEFDGFAGAIAIDRYGNVHHDDSHPYMVWGKWDDGVSVLVNESLFELITAKLMNKLLVLFCIILLFACSQKVKKAIVAEQALSYDAVKFGEGGGITGAYSAYKIQRNGELSREYRFPARPLNEKFLRQTSPDTVKMIFDKVKAFENLNYNKTANLTYSLDIIRDSLTHHISWGNERNDTVSRLRELYSEMKSLLAGNK